MREYYHGYKDEYYGNEDLEETEEEIKEKNEKKVRTRLLTIIQITVCSILLMTALFLKFTGSNAYTVIKNWYFTNVNQTIIPDERIENVKNKVIELFPAPSSQQPAISKPSSDSAQSTAPKNSAVQSAPNSQGGANTQSAVNSQNAENQQNTEGSQQTSDTPAADNTQLIN